MGWCSLLGRLAVRSHSRAGLSGAGHVNAPARRASTSPTALITLRRTAEARPSQYAGPTERDAAGWPGKHNTHVDVGRLVRSAGLVCTTTLQCRRRDRHDVMRVRSGIRGTLNELPVEAHCRYRVFPGPQHSHECDHGRRQQLCNGPDLCGVGPSGAVRTARAGGCCPAFCRMGHYITSNITYRPVISSTSEQEILPTYRTRNRDRHRRQEKGGVGRPPPPKTSSPRPHTSAGAYRPSTSTRNGLDRHSASR